MATRDEFPKVVVDALAKRAAFICSNSDCRAQTVAPSEDDDSKFIYIGKASHIAAASAGGPRFDESMSAEERKSIANGIFLCSNCADMVDKNNGRDYSVEQLRKWKREHESWVSTNLNKRLDRAPGVVTEISVTSVGQSGGITAGVVNVGAQPRKLNAKVQQRLVEVLPDKEGDVTITAVMGDGEAFQFATEIKEFLAGQGYSVKGVNQAVYSNPVAGQSVDPEKRTITIGTK